MSTQAPTRLGVAAVAVGGVWTATEVALRILHLTGHDRRGSFDLRGVIFAVTVVVWVVTCAWLDRCRLLLPATQHRHSRFTLCAGWVWPIISLWVPYGAVADIVTGATGSRPAWLRWWWAVWLIWLLFGLPGSNQRLLDQGAQWLSTLATVAMVVAYVFWVRIVLGVTRSLQVAPAEPTMVA